ncbi:MAG: amidase [Chloroflexi bacterium]|nr:amidase [Chloroflexota bacterium]MYI04805.1 amidase [Chloroflexota bacterium]
MPDATTLNLVQPLSLSKQVAAARSGALSLQDLIAQSLDRLDEVNPLVRAMLPDPRQRERLSAEAATLMERWPSPEDRPPLFGAMVAVKDIFNVDRMPTRAGSAVPPESFSGREADVVARLKETGALVLGKAVTTEFAYFASGATANPHDREHTPGGSSSGSAAAVAAGIAPLAVGSQTVGSVIRPASFCGAVGFKPSYDRIPTGGTLYFSPSVDTIGFFVNSVTDATLAASALLLGWRNGEDAEATTPRIGIPAGPFLEQAGQEVRAALAQATELLSDAGIDIADVMTLHDIADINKRHSDLTVFEFTETHRERYAKYGAMFRPQSAEFFETGLAVSPATAETGRASRIALRQRLHERMDRAGIDVWLAPSAVGPAPHGLGSTGDPRMNLPWTHAGMPVINLPFGDVDGLPLGLSLVGRFGHDETLLGQALRVEDALAG